MYSVYRLRANELDGRFLEALKALFRGKEIEIEIAVSEVIEQEEIEYEPEKSIFETIEEMEPSQRYV